MISLVIIFIVMIMILYTFYMLFSKFFPGYESIFLFYFIIPIIVLATAIIIAIVYSKQIEKY